MQIEDRSCNVLGEDDTTTSVPKRARTEEPLDDAIEEKKIGNKM